MVGSAHLTENVMQYRRFGRTNLSMSVLSLGTMRCLASVENMTATVAAALAGGINHLETARGYGQSEAYLGQALRELGGRDRLYLTTKIPPMADATAMTAAIQDSLARLQVDYIDCLAIHGINTPQHWEWVQAGMGAARSALSSGQIRHIGFSTHGPLELIEEVIRSGWFEFVNLHYSVFFQRNAPLLDLAQAQDLGVFIISPADKAGMLYQPPDRLAELCQPLSPLAVNYRFLLSDPRVTTLSVGPAEPAELDWPMGLVESVGPLTGPEAQVLERLAAALRSALPTDLCSQCYACLPCPEGIHIPEVLRLRNLAVAYDMQAFGEYRYGMFEKAGHWFPGNKGNRCTDCGDCLPRCPEQLDIPRLLRDTHARLNGKPRRRLWGED
jgi:uncharacterized protein